MQVQCTFNQTGILKVSILVLSNNDLHGFIQQNAWFKLTLFPNYHVPQ